MIRNNDIHVAKKSGLDGIFWTRHSAGCWTDGLCCPEGKGVRIEDNEAIVTDEEGNDWKVVIIAFNDELKAVMRDNVCYNDLSKVMNKSSHWRTDWNVLQLLTGFHGGNSIGISLDPKYFGLIPSGKKLEEYPAWEDEDGLYHEWGLVAV